MDSIERRVIWIRKTERVDGLTIKKDEKVKFFSYTYFVKDRGKWRPVVRWDNYDSQNNLMVEPRYNDSTFASFSLGNYALSDVERDRVLAPDTINNLSSPRSFVQHIDGFRSWINSYDIEGARVIVDKLTPDGAQIQRLQITVD